MLKEKLFESIESYNVIKDVAKQANLQSSSIFLPEKTSIRRSQQGKVQKIYSLTETPPSLQDQ